jgi:hypothetical protein
MKANEAPKSKFVYPDKLYARTNDNITLDISYAPQTLEAVEYIRKDAFIEKTSWWIERNIKKWYENIKVHGFRGMTPLMITEFKKCIEGE